MKKTIILLLFIFSIIPKQGYGQYESIFGSQNSTWNIISMLPDYYCTNTFTVTGDTIINSTNYKVIERNGQIFNFVREDTAQGKIWYFDSFLNNEYLLADFNLSVGDSFEISNTQYHVDSVYYFDNKKHIQLNSEVAYSNSGLYFTFIEGVGSSAGFSYNNNQQQSDFVLCQTKDTISSLLYNQFDIHIVDTCYYCYVGIESVANSSEYTIYPNPCYSHVEISSSQYPIELMIYNSFGQLVKSQKVLENHLDLDVGGLDNGIYLFTLLIEGEIVETKKVVKIE